MPENHNAHTTTTHHGTHPHPLVDPLETLDEYPDRAAIPWAG